jgi:amino acid adenylation domain-containing protein
MTRKRKPGGDIDESASRTELFFRLRAGAGLPAPAGLKSRRGGAPAPLSFAQERLWFLDQLQPGNSAYHICRAQRLRGPLDPAALGRALDQVARRQEALRTSFRRAPEGTVQIVSESPNLQISALDGGAWNAAELARRIAEEARRPFDLSVGPLLRIALFKLAAAEHVLVVTVHQMIFDGWSIGLFFKELAALYEQETGGRPAALPHLPVQYADYALWQREQAAGQALQSQAAFWKSRLGGALPILALPTARGRPPIQAHRGARRFISIRRPLLSGLLALGRRCGATLFEVLMAAFNVLLYRYSGQTDLLIGFPVANRERREVENLIGFFVNTLALRTVLAGNPAFAQLLRRVRGGLREAYQYRELPFEKLVEELRVERDLSRNPIFQAMFAYQNEAASLLRLPGVISQPVESDPGGAKFDLMLSLARGENKLSGFFEYDRDLFEASFIDRMAGHWQTLLRGIVADPEQRLSRLPLLSDPERRGMAQWNSIRRDLPERLCLHQMFEAQAARTPGAVAVEGAGEVLTYGELNRQANRLARLLRALGVGPETVVGVALERRPELPVVLLGVLKAGGAYLPIDPAYPPERIGFLLDDAQVELLITRIRLIEDRGWRTDDRWRAPGFDRLTKVLCLDRDAALIRNWWKETDPNFKVRSKNLAYLIYTSGSTGQPKGVAVEHRNAAALLGWARSVFSPEELSGVLASTSICFDLSVFEIFLPLCAGGTVILVENALQLNACLAKNRVTLVNTVPSVMRELLAGGGLPPSVRVVNLAGEPLSADLVRQVYHAGAVKKVYDLYGPSETTTYSTFALRTPESRATIGRPVANTRIYILDENLQPLPAGVAGEIFIGGAGVARGYLNRPELTRDGFLPDPFARSKSARMYRTGDLGRFLDDGNIEYLGRLDRQVKIRGYRIEPGEIEAALDSHPAIAQSIVVARAREVFQAPPAENPQSAIRNPPSDPRLVAYLVSRGGLLPAAGKLQTFLRRRLPEFMLPEVFLPLDRVPLNANGKIDDRALPQPEGERAGAAGKFVPPRDEIEELIAGTWRDALGIEPVGVNDNFFELGGHSLLAARVAGRLRASFGIELEIRKLFEMPTVAALARHIEQLRGHQSATALPAPGGAAAGDQAPLSFAQRRLWFLHRLEPRLTAYNMPAAYRIQGPLDLAAFGKALTQMLDRHESLRTAMVEIDGEPAQRIFDHVKIKIPIVELAGRAGAEKDAEIRQRLDEEARQPFDLGGAPLLRLRLLRFAREDHALLITFHHMIADATSLAIFYRELAAFYEAASRRGVARMPAVTARYADFAVWQRDGIEHPAFKTQLEYWKQRLGGKLAPLDLPRDFEPSKAPPFRGARWTRRLPAQLTEAIQGAARRQGATLFMTLLAALKVLLGRWSGREDIVVGTTVAGRSRTEFEGVIGFFINAVALRTDLSGSPTFAELLGRVRESCLDALSCQDVPFERVVEEIRPQRDFGRNPIFQVLFNMNDVGERDLYLAGCAVEKITAPALDAKFDVVAQAPQIDGGIELTMIYNAERFTEARIAALLDQWSFLLEQVAADPAKPVGEYSLLPAGAKGLLPDPTQALDDGWHGTIHALVSRLAQRQPQAAALVDDRQSWSYGELDRASSRLAHFLIAGGIAPGDAVAIYAHRDASLAAALLGVLKAGGVFLILDPAYPARRLAEYWRIARPRALLHMEGAGPLPEELEKCCADAPVRWVLPSAVEEFARRFGAFPDQAPDVETGADDPAYIAFTSGSTGEPKGVLCRHGPITHFLPWQEQAFDLKNSDRYGLLSGLAYNHLHRDLFTALATGATVHVPAPDCLREPARLADWLRDREMTVVHLTPALARLLCGTAKKLPALRRVLLGGDVLTRRDAREMHLLAPNAELGCFYGATEAQRAVGYFPISREMFAGEAGAGRILPVGRGIPDVQLLLLTPGGQLAGVGEVGEIYIRSPHLACGYLGDPALTAAAFLANPFTGQAGDRLYRTGDFGRYAPDGSVEWAGRGERRANLRGFRVELAEIEAMIKRFAGVKNCAVALKGIDSNNETEGRDARLVAYLESGPDARIGPEELRRFLRERLPDYMVPAHFQLMERLPIGPNGKIDYSSLPPPDLSDARSAPPFAPPQGALEQTLSEVLAELLGVERLGRHDNFFDRGGHSLLAARAAARIGERLHTRLEVRAIFESPTVEALARRIEAARSAPSAEVEDSEREEIEL